MSQRRSLHRHEQDGEPKMESALSTLLQLEYTCNLLTGKLGGWMIHEITQLFSTPILLQVQTLTLGF